MSEYAKRTCNVCGLRLPQPEMNQKFVTTQVAKGKRGLSTREIAGALIGSKKSTNSIFNWLFAPNVRNYSRKQKVWLCDACSGEASTEHSNFIEKSIQKNGVFGSISKLYIWLLIFLSTVIIQDCVTSLQGTKEAPNNWDAWNAIVGIIILTQLYYVLALIIRPKNRRTFTSFTFQYCSAITLLLLCLATSKLEDIWIISFSIINLYLLHRSK